MPTTVTGADKVAAALKPVSVGSQRLRVPVSPPLGFMFKHGAFLRKLGASEASDEDVEGYYGEIVDFLEHYNPSTKFSEAKLQAECSLADLLSFYNRWWGAAQDDDEPDEGEARPPQRRGTSGASRTARKSRS